MASQTVRFEYDPGRNILFADDDYEISTEQDVDTFLALYDSTIRGIGRKIWIVTGIDGLEVHSEIADYYGMKLKELAGQWYLGIARWGINPVSRMSVRTASVKVKHEINIHDTKEQALRTVEDMRK